MCCCNLSSNSEPAMDALKQPERGLAACCAVAGPGRHEDDHDGGAGGGPAQAGQPHRAEGAGGALAPWSPSACHCMNACMHAMSLFRQVLGEQGTCIRMLCMPLYLAVASA